ncbi:MAG: hypothetical protein AB1547_06990 [Thermodesulfobacteriota bacterium]
MPNAHVVLFPFTWISEDRARELSAWFGSPLMLLQTTGRTPEDIIRLERQGYVWPKCPVSGMDEALQQRIEVCNRWMEAHPRQQDTAFLKAAAHLPQSDAEAMSAHIRGEILRYGRQEPVAARTDPLLDSLVFLCLAEELDRQQAAVEAELKRVEHLETSVFRKLIGEDTDIDELPPGGPFGISEGDTEPDHPVERLRAWTLLALQEPDLPDIWLTTSRLVMEALIEAIPEIGSTKVTLSGQENPEKASEVFCRLLGTNDFARWMPNPGKPSMSLDAYVVDGRSPRDVLNALRSRPKALPPSGTTSGSRSILLYCRTGRQLHDPEEIEPLHFPVSSPNSRPLR